MNLMQLLEKTYIAQLILVNECERYSYQLEHP